MRNVLRRFIVELFDQPHKLVQTCRDVAVLSLFLEIAQALNEQLEVFFQIADGGCLLFVCVWRVDSDGGGGDGGGVRGGRDCSRKRFIIVYGQEYACLLVLTRFYVETSVFNR